MPNPDGKGGKRFSPGNKAAPGGKREAAGRKTLTIREARAELHLHTIRGKSVGLFAWHTLCNQMDAKTVKRPDPVRIMACCKVLDRIFGKDAQSLNLEVRGNVDVRTLLAATVSTTTIERFSAPAPRELPSESGQGGGDARVAADVPARHLGVSGNGLPRRKGR